MGIAHDTVEPEKNLSMLIKRELGVDIDKAALRIFIRAHWHDVQGFAHAIHDEPYISAPIERTAAERELIKANASQPTGASQ